MYPSFNVHLHFVTQAIKIRESLDGKNIEFVLTELGVRLHRIIYDHLQQFSYNSSGVMAVICDVQVNNRAEIHQVS